MSRTCSSAPAETFASEPWTSESTTATSSPRATSASTTCEPMKPAPPVTIARTGASYAAVTGERFVVQADDGVQLVGELVAAGGAAAVAGRAPSERLGAARSRLEHARAGAGRRERVRGCARRARRRVPAVRQARSRRLGRRLPHDELRAGDDDAKAALGALRGSPGIDADRVTVVGHSLGGTIAIRLAAASESAGGRRPAQYAGRVRRGGHALAVRAHRRVAARSCAAATRQLPSEPGSGSGASCLASTGDTVSIDGVETARSLVPRGHGVRAGARPPARFAARCLRSSGRNDVQVDPDDVERMRRLVVSPFEGEAPTDLTHLLRQACRPGLDAYPEQLKEPVDSVAARARRIVGRAAADPTVGCRRCSSRSKASTAPGSRRRRSSSARGSRRTASTSSRRASRAAPSSARACAISSCTAGTSAPWAEALLYVAARAQLVDEVIRPALERGATVICDRYVDSSIAYQGVGRELGLERVLDLNLAAVGGLLPDSHVPARARSERGAVAHPAALRSARARG